MLHPFRLTGVDGETYKEKFSQTLVWVFCHWVVCPERRQKHPAYHRCLHNSATTAWTQQSMEPEAPSGMSGAPSGIHPEKNILISIDMFFVVFIFFGFRLFFSDIKKLSNKFNIIQG
jgi:hypothetical protein